MYVGRNEEMFMHAFNCFARIVRVPDAQADEMRVGKGRRLGKSTGQLFRDKHADLVQKALDLLVDNSAREIPPSASAERAQKAQLSTALTNFLQACSGPDNEHGHRPDAPPVWPQAVSVLQMRDATQSMIEVMKNEERLGEAHQKLELENSALADTIEPILHTLPQVQPTGAIKARLLNRLAALLEGEPGPGDAFENTGTWSRSSVGTSTGAPDTNAYPTAFHGFLANEGGPVGDTAGGKAEEEPHAMRRKRMQGHVSFLRRNGVDLVLTQLENQLSEHRQIRRGEIERNTQGSLSDDPAQAALLGHVLPLEAAPERAMARTNGVLRFVELEEARGEVRLTAGDIKDEQVDFDSAVADGLDWQKSGIGVLFSPQLHLMADLSEDQSNAASGSKAGGSTPSLADATLLQSSSSRRHVQRHSETDEARHTAEQQKNIEASVAATLRVLAACVRHGSPETRAGFLRAFGKDSMQQDVFKIAGYAFIFTQRQQSEAALRFVEFWNEVLRAMADDGTITLDQLPLLDTLATLLPRLLAPIAQRMSASLDLWRRTRQRDGLAAANQELLNQQLAFEGGYHRMLGSLDTLARLYLRMLRSIEVLTFSKNMPLDTAAKELTLRQLLPPSTADSADARGEFDTTMPDTGGSDGRAPDVRRERVAQPSNSALLAFLSALFFDVVLRLAEGWHAGAGGAGLNDVERVTRQQCIAAIKALLASFCVIDEERRFELFQLTARLEARWGVTLPPALMCAIRAVTAEELFKRALAPYLIDKGVLDSEGEHIVEACWMVQELPRRMRTPTVMVLVTNRAVYLLAPAVKQPCNVCEPWKLCPEGPRLKYRLPFYRIRRIILDFAAKFNCGQRMKLICMQDAGEHNVVRAASWPNVFETCTACFHSRSGDQRNAAFSSSSLPGRMPRPKPAKIELQFSTLHVGVVDRLAASIERLMDPRPVELVRDSHQLQALAFQSASTARMRAADGGVHDRGSRLDKLSPTTFRSSIDPIDALFDAPNYNCRFAVRCEQLHNGSGSHKSNGASKHGHQRLLVLTDNALSIFVEEPELFNVPLEGNGDSLEITDAGGDNVSDNSAGAGTASGHKGRNGADVVHLETVIDVNALEKLELEMSAEPKVHLLGADFDGHSNDVLLQFADDTAALLFRMQVRSILWDKGHAEWRSHTLIQSGL